MGDEDEDGKLEVKEGRFYLVVKTISDSGAVMGKVGKCIGTNPDGRSSLFDFGISGYHSWWVNHEALEEVDEMGKKKEKNKPKLKYTYKPGSSVADYVKELLKLEKDADRAKWLRTFDNCVLPERVRRTIDEAITIVMLAHKFDEWGITENFEKGLTNSILIYGPPGTGKTMISESIAAVLGKNLMKISSGDIQSNIPGQTERNIQESFAKAKAKNCVILFDECDSVLSDRNAVGTIMAAEINALLTEIERYDGVVILTTNRLHRLDPALQRRIIARVKLEPPTREARELIWGKLLPKKMPLAKDVDIPALSSHKLTGGDIKNVILLSARKAIAKNKEEVTMADFVECIEQELDAQEDFENNRPHAAPDSVYDIGPSVDKQRDKREGEC